MVDASRDDVDQLSEEVNPYEAPHSHSEEAVPRTKTLWRIIPATILVLASLLALAFHGLCIFIVLQWFYYGLTRDDVVITSADFPISGVFFCVGIIGLVGDAIGLYGALSIWRGNWKVASTNTALFIMLAVLSFAAVFLMGG